MNNKALYHIFFLFLSIIFIQTLSAQCPEIIWADEFDGQTLDPTKWSHQIGDGCPNLCGWGNSELEYYQPGNTTVSDGTLKITAKRENVGGKNYTSSRIRSIQNGDFTYGRFEARIKLPTGQGLWPAFWMLSTDEPYGGWPRSGELDIMELVGNEPDVTHGTLHYGPAWPNNRSTTATYSLNEGIFNDNFHVFAIEWEVGEIRWYVDDYLYSTKTRADLSPERWPFDHDFHFLLNVAVGGNWPGNPNGSTVFPQTMEVDYVRVYDGVDFPHLRGKRTVKSQAEAESYTIANLPSDATVNWVLPEGASIVSGQGTAQISVNWGKTGGEVMAEVSASCFTKVYALEVMVEAAQVRDISIENFDDEAQVKFTSSTGNLQEVNNPMSNDINSSTLVGKYDREQTEQYDVLVYETRIIGNARAFLENEKKFYIDVLTDAPVGTLILLQMENSSRANQNFPTGRHSRFQVFTTKQNEWDRLEFSLLDRPDTGTSDNAVNQLVLLFASDSFTGNTFHFDNFDIYAAEKSVVNIKELAFSSDLKIFPNPVRENLQIQNEGELNFTQLTVYDTAGKHIKSKAIQLSRAENQSIEVENLSMGTYFLQLMDDQGREAWARFVVSR